MRTRLARHLPALALAPLLLLPVGGCALLGSLGGALDAYTPKVSFQKLALTSIDFQKVGVDFVFRVDNPNPVSVTSSSFTYDLALEGQRLMQGDQAQGIKLKSSGPSEVALPVSVAFTDIVKLVGALSGKDKVGYTLVGAFGFNTPLGPVSIPYNTAGDFPMLHKPDIRVAGLRAKGLNLLQQTATLSLDIGVANKQGGSTLQFNALNYALALGGGQVATGDVASLPAVEKGKEAVVSVPIVLNLGQVGAVVYKAVMSKQAIDFKLAGKVGVGTPWGAVPLSFDRAGNVPIQSAM